MMYMYAAIVVLFAAAGILDIVSGDVKTGVVALGFGAINCVIFFWRT